MTPISNERCTHSEAGLAVETNSPLADSLSVGGDCCSSDNSEFAIRTLPELSVSQLSRRFEIELNNIEVTSLDIVSHGCYVFAGCSNGMILLFDMSSTSRQVDPCVVCIFIIMYLYAGLVY